MWGRVLGLIGTVWGGSVILYSLTTNPPPEATQAYKGGQSFALIFGVLLFLAGLTAFIRSFKKPGPP
jgi:hypothetical protein